MFFNFPAYSALSVLTSQWCHILKDMVLSNISMESNIIWVPVMGYSNTIGLFYQALPICGKYTILQKYADIGLELTASVAAHLVNTLPNVCDSNYHRVIDNLFTSLELPWHLSLKQIAVPRTLEQFHPFASKDTILQEYADVDLGLGVSVVAYLANTLPNAGDSNYHRVTDNLFTSPELLRHLSSKQIAATGTILSIYR